MSHLYLWGTLDSRASLWTGLFLHFLFCGWSGRPWVQQQAFIYSLLLFRPPIFLHSCQRVMWKCKADSVISLLIMFQKFPHALRVNPHPFPWPMGARWAASACLSDLFLLATLITQRLIALQLIILCDLLLFTYYLFLPLDRCLMRADKVFSFTDLKVNDQ